MTHEQETKDTSAAPSHPTDAQGERLKFPINTSVVFDMAQQREVKYPLAISAG